MRIRVVTLAACMTFAAATAAAMAAGVWREARFQPVDGKPYSIHSYKYTNFIQGLVHEADVHDLVVDGTKEVVTTWVPFSPTDIHIEYTFSNRSLVRVRHNIWKTEKGGSFTWQWYKAPVGDEGDQSVCEAVLASGEPAGPPTCCVEPPADEFACSRGDSCTSMTCFPREEPESGDVRVPPIPTVSEWGMIVITLLLLTAITVVFGRRRRRAAA